jgi:hypothetical protein
MLVTAHVMVLWLDMTEELIKLLFSLLASSAFAVTVIPCCISVLLIKCCKPKSIKVLSSLLSYTTDHSISHGKILGQKYGSAGNGIDVFENTQHVLVNVTIEWGYMYRNVHTFHATTSLHW